MVEIITSHNQTLLDIALMITGNADDAYELAKANGMEVSDDLVVGTAVRYGGVVSNKNIVRYYSEHNIVPGTDITGDSVTGIKIFDNTFDNTFE